MPRKPAKKSPSKKATKKVSAATAAAAKSRKRSTVGGGRPSSAARQAKQSGKPLAEQLGEVLVKKAGKGVVLRRPSPKAGAAPAAGAATVMPTPPQAEPISLIPFIQLQESPLNPRRDFDQAKLWELARSIAQDGVLQNLVARPVPRTDSFELVSGARRYRAVAMLVEEGKVPDTYQLPVRIIDCSDVELIRMATVENVQRQDMHPLEEGECFRALRAAGDTTENIATLIGKSQRWVQKRIDLVERLGDKVKEQFRGGAITVWQAEALAKAEPKRQETLAKNLKQGLLRTAKDIVNAITADKPAVKHALFDVALYDGGFIEEDDGKGRWFDDQAKFEKLQTEAIEAKRADLAGKWAWVEVHSQLANQFPSLWNYGRSKDPKKAGAIIIIRRDWSIQIETGLVKPQEKKPAKGAAKKKAAKKATGAGGEGLQDELPAATITQQLMIYAKNRKTEALQEAIAFDGNHGARAAMIMVCLALMGARECVKIRQDEIRRDDQVLAPFVRAALDKRRPDLERVLDLPEEALAEEDVLLPGVEKAGELTAEDYFSLKSWEDEADVVDEGAIDSIQVRAYGLLNALSIEHLQSLFAALVAARCGSFVDFRPELGDHGLARKVAAALKVDMADAWSADGWEKYIGLCKKGRLVRLTWDMPALMIAPGRAAKMKTDALAAEILQTLEAKPELKRQVPIELTFTDAKTIEDAISAPVASLPAPDATPAAKADSSAASEAPPAKRKRGRASKDHQQMAAE